MPNGQWSGAISAGVAYDMEYVHATIAQEHIGALNKYT